MGDSIKELMNSLNITMAADSFPVLENLKYFRDYNNYISNSFNRDKPLLDNNDQRTENEPRKLTLELLTFFSEEKKYNAFANIMKVSLLTSLCSFIEIVITTPCITLDTDRSYSKFKNKYPKKRKPSTIQIAREFLLDKGVLGLNEIPNWEYIFDMMKIRNCFIHADGRSNNHVSGIASLYDFTIVEGKIVLGNDFISNYIDILELFAVSIARLVYPDEGFMKKIGFEVDTQKLSEALKAFKHFKGLVKVEE